ncbi:hypothetical protein CB1_000958013 [Camelus ferus]|nr:hypothetical protein CB1_000958013 [Camelus ferus]
MGAALLWATCELQELVLGHVGVADDTVHSPAIEDMLLACAGEAEVGGPSPPGQAAGLMEEESHCPHQVAETSVKNFNRVGCCGCVDCAWFSLLEDQDPSALKERPNLALVGLRAGLRASPAELGPGPSDVVQLCLPHNAEGRP